MKKSLLTILLLIISFNSYSANDKVLKIYAEEDFAPFNYYDNMFEFKGASVEIVNKILENAKFQHTKIKVIPWARSYHLTENQPNTMLFSMYRTPFRENKFKWAGPIFNSDIILLIKKGRTIDPKNFTVAAVRSSASMQTAKKYGITEDRLIRLNERSLSLKLLMTGRVDAWAVSTVNAKKIIKLKGLDFNDFQIYKTMANRSLYFGFNKQTDKKIIEHFQHRLEELKHSGFINKILEKYSII